MPTLCVTILPLIGYAYIKIKQYATPQNILLDALGCIMRELHE
jgi:hypothetical protein